VNAPPACVSAKIFVLINLSMLLECIPEGLRPFGMKVTQANPTNDGYSNSLGINDLPIRGLKGASCEERLNKWVVVKLEFDEYKLARQYVKWKS
jgi:hypothetical protein